MILCRWTWFGWKAGSTWGWCGWWGEGWCGLGWWCGRDLVERALDSRSTGFSVKSWCHCSWDKRVEKMPKTPALENTGALQLEFPAWIICLFLGKGVLFFICYELMKRDFLASFPLHTLIEPKTTRGPWGPCNACDVTDEGTGSDWGQNDHSGSWEQSTTPRLLL